MPSPRKEYRTLGEHDWGEDLDGVIVCRNCSKHVDEADEQEEPAVCWAEVEG